jgi:transcriptional regulator NrdR family protein
MNCSDCGNQKIKTKEVRSFHDPVNNFYYVERRRQCLSCHHKFKTIELDIKDYTRVIAGESEDESEDDDEQTS